MLFMLITSCSSIWRVASVNGPEPRYISTLIYSDNSLLLFGGKNNSSNGFDDLWEWNGKEWNMIGNGATKRWDHNYVYMKTMDQLFLFGGRTFEQIQGKQERIDLNDNWIYKNKVWKQINIPSPEQRSSHGLVYDEKRNSVILFGGRNKESIFKDTWSFNGKEWKKLEVSGPKRRFGHTLAYDRKSGNIYLFGGHDGQNLLNDFWAFDGNIWVEIESMAKPSHRMAHAMQFDNEGNAILFGGWDDSNSVSGEMWFWVDGKWKICDMEKTPQARLSSAIGYDLSRNEFIFFGGNTGFSGQFLPETWKLSLAINKIH